MLDMKTCWLMICVTDKAINGTNSTSHRKKFTIAESTR